MFLWHLHKFAPSIKKRPVSTWLGEKMLPQEWILVESTFSVSQVYCRPKKLVITRKFAPKMGKIVLFLGDITFRTKRKAHVPTWRSKKNAFTRLDCCVQWLFCLPNLLRATKPVHHALICFKNWKIEVFCHYYKFAPVTKNLDFSTFKAN